MGINITLNRRKVISTLNEICRFITSNLYQSLNFKFLSHAEE